VSVLKTALSWVWGLLLTPISCIAKTFCCVGVKGMKLGVQLTTRVLYTYIKYRTKISALNHNLTPIICLKNTFSVLKLCLWLAKQSKLLLSLLFCPQGFNETFEIITSPLFHPFFFNPSSKLLISYIFWWTARKIESVKFCFLSFFKNKKFLPSKTAFEKFGRILDERKFNNIINMKFNL